MIDIYSIWEKNTIEYKNVNYLRTFCSSQNKLNTACKSLQSSPSTVCLPFQTHLMHWWEFLFPNSPSRQGLRARKWQDCCSQPRRLQKSSSWVRQDTLEVSGCRPACRTCQHTYLQKWCFRKEQAAHKEEISVSLIAFWYFKFCLQQRNISSAVKSRSTWTPAPHPPPRSLRHAAVPAAVTMAMGTGKKAKKRHKGFTVITNIISMFTS